MQALRGGLEQAGDARFLPRFLLLLGELAVCLGKAGEVVRGLATVEETLARCEARDERWYAAELLRIKGDSRYRRMRPTPLPKDTSCKPSTVPDRKEPCPGNCEPPSASRGYGEINIELPRRATF